MPFISPNALPHRAPYRSATCPTMRHAEALSKSDVLIIGGGPTGSAALAHFHKRGISATLFEKQNDFTDFNVTRAYCLRLDHRAVRVLEQVPGMYEHLSNLLQTTTTFSTSVLSASNERTGFIATRPRPGSPDLCDLRPAVVNSMKSFVTQLSGVSTRYGVTLTDIRIAENGIITVVMDTPDGVATHETRLLLACDGRNSRVAELLQRAESRGEPVKAPYGHGVESFNSPAVGLHLKSIVFDEDVINDTVCKRDPHVFLVRAMRGDPSRSIDDVFQFSIFPAGPESTRGVGGFVGTIVRKPNHNVWKLADVESAYEFFQANFPQLDVRKAISEKEMRRFVTAKTSQFGDIRRRKSLAITTGSGGNGGAVVFLGDSAHAFPPDIGQGVCAAIGDVGVFMDVLDTAEEDATLEDIVMRYDQIRSDEGKALMRISQFASPYQYGVYQTRLKLWLVNVGFRKALSRLLPGIFWPQMATMLPDDITYREIVRRADVTTSRLFGGAAAIAAAVVAVMVRSQFTG